MNSRNVDIVLVRMDKIGDLVLTMPVDEHPALGGCREHWFISSGLGFVPENALPRRSFTEFKRSFSPFEFMRMVKWLRANRPRTIVLLHNPWWVSFAAWCCRVPERIGRLSQWHSFLFLNLGVRQKRSDSDRHESDYNFDLVETGFARMGVRSSLELSQFKKKYLYLRGPGDSDILQKKNLQSEKYHVVHPGMAGSALNWPSESYRELILRLAEMGPVVITGTKMDAKYLEPLKSLSDNINVGWLVGELNTRELLDVLAASKGVVAPSTGVLHLAASLGRPTVGIYSPRKVEHPRRWGPRGANVAFLVPQVEEQEKYPADVMNGVSAAEVFNKLMELERGNASLDSQPLARH